MKANLKLILSALAVVFVALATHAQEGKLQKAEAKFCTRLQEFGDALEKLDGINENSTMDEFRSAYKKAQKSWNRLSKAGAKLEKVEMKESQKAYDALVKSINEIEGDVKTSDATAEINQNIDDTALKIAEITDVVCIEE